MKVLVTKRAEKKFNSLITYLKEQWGERVTDTFRQRVIYFVDLLKEYPELGSVEVPEKQIGDFN